MISASIPAEIRFVDESTPQNEITFRHWEFGDGSHADDVTVPVHVYTRVGTYVVRLYVSSPKGSAMTSDVVEATP